MAFEEFPIGLNAVIFLAGAALIWVAGTKLERYIDEIAVRTGLGRAFLGLLALSAATSLPEVATTLTATWRGNTSMAVHNLLGGIVMQSSVLALADLFMGRRALTHVAPHYSVLLQANGLMGLLAAVLLGMPLLRQTMEESPQFLTPAVVGWCLLLLGCYLVMLYQTYRSQRRPKWHAVDAKEDFFPNTADRGHPLKQVSLRQLSIRFAIGSGVVLLAGWSVAVTGEALATQTGLSASFVGFTLVAIATSLPELSTTIAATRAGNPETAFGNIFGSNAFDASLLVLVAAVAGPTALVQNLTTSTQFATALGIFLTGIYLWGLLERQDRTVWRVGWDSAAVLVLAILGNGVVFWLK